LGHFNGQLQQQNVRSILEKLCYSNVTILICNIVWVTLTAKYNNRQ
jgi:hypothetical protein